MLFSESYGLTLCSVDETTYEIRRGFNGGGKVLEGIPDRFPYTLTNNSHFDIIGAITTIGDKVENISINTQVSLAELKPPFSINDIPFEFLGDSLLGRIGTPFFLLSEITDKVYGELPDLFPKGTVLNQFEKDIFPEFRSEEGLSFLIKGFRQKSRVPRQLRKVEKEFIEAWRIHT